MENGQSFSGHFWLVIETEMRPLGKECVWRLEGRLRLWLWLWSRVRVGNARYSGMVEECFKGTKRCDVK